MSGDKMIFPLTWKEYENDYGFTDKEQVYTNGIRLIPSFRVEQWLEHIEESRPKGKWVEHKNNHDIYYCSECETDALYYFGKPFGEYRVFQVRSEYCPCCGADMRGEYKEVENGTDK